MAWCCQPLHYLILVVSFRLQCCEMFTSVAHLEAFVDTKFELLKRLDDHIKHSEEKMRDLKHFMEQCDYAEPNRNSKAVNSSAPAHAVKLLLNISRVRRKRRAVFAWFSDVKDQRKQLKTYFGEIRKHLPSKEDVEGAARAIIRLQQTYELDVAAFIETNVLHAGRPIKLALDEIYHIGRTSFLLEKMSLTKQWMLLALEKYSNRTEESEMRTFNPKSDVNYAIDIRDHLAYANFKLGKYKESLKYTKEILQRDEFNEQATSNLEILHEKLSDKNCDDNHDEIAKEDYYLQHKYEALCRNEYRQKYLKERLLDNRFICGYAKRNPLLALQPMKYELVSINPEIYLYYEMVSNYEVKVLKRLAFPQLERAVVSEKNELQPASYRISKSGWLHNDQHDVVKKLNRRMESITGLSIETSEDLQIANYGIGGHYEPHYDWSRNFDNSEMKKVGHGNRIATGLLYLNDVASGGATVFPDANLAIFPEKGTLAFWYNLHLNGRGKTSTIHAACPVALGTKWVANKWFHERGQEFRRPCSKNKWD